MVTKSAQSIRIIYMGTPDFAVAPLKALVENGYNVVAVVTVPDKPAGRGQKLQQSAVKVYAQTANLPVLQPPKLKDEEFLNTLRRYDGELFIVVAFRMLPEVVWQIPTLGTFNLHASLLPQYRGAAPINRAIINGEAVTGVTTFFINNEIDAGKIIFSEKVEITHNDNAATLHDKLMEAGAVLVLKTVDAIASDSVNLQQQPESENLKTAPKIFKEMCKIDWSQRPEEIYNFVRGLSPYPAAWCELTGKNQQSVSAKIYSAAYENIDHHLPFGTVKSDGKSFLKIACNGGFISITDIQLAGKKRLSVREFLTGFRDIEDYVVAP
ncbi:MAG: methionyl-tRNA formyltransferase [Prevotellaceae bacterium]|jgi:methionyl-tRNA formyltransferase|nr:methionyl-tRNA formyltransferase [Prevotellaceae bacterium]